MTSWATRRKLLYIAILVVFALLVIGLPGFLYVYKPPTCTDGKQNGKELGIDCGGPCTTLCRAQAFDPIVHWQRAFKVSPGYYNVAAYIENPNIDSRALNVPYLFRVYDEIGDLIAEKKGVTDILPNTSFPVFDSGVLTGLRSAKRTTFELTETPVWQTYKVKTPDLAVTKKVLTKEDSAPRLEVTIQNRSLTNLKRIPVYAIIYDIDGNVLNISRTSIDLLEAEKSTDLVFTWPIPFEKPASRIDVFINTMAASVAQ